MRRALGVALALALGACDNPRTEVVVVVDSVGLAVPRDFDTLHVTVADKALSGDAATLFDSQPFPLCHDGATSGCYDLPVTFTLVPGAHRPDDPVRVHVQALLGTQVAIDDAATFTFLKGKSARLDFRLFPACLDSHCAESDRVCGADGQCTTISPAPFSGEPDLASGPRDGGGGDDGGIVDLSTFDLTLPSDLAGTCDGGLVDLTSDPNNCGACGVVCTNPTPAPNTAPICAARACSIGCQTGWGDCDHVAGNGCEHDVSADPQNCGACGHVCGNANTVGAMAKCASNACVFNCSPGTTHCSSNDATGCETTTGTDPHNCGSCGFDCGTATCINGLCRYTKGAEAASGQPGTSILVQDASALYWFNDNCSGGPVSIRHVDKSGANLGDVFNPAKIGCTDQGAMLAVDKNYLYFFNDTYKHLLYRGVKTGVQDPSLLLDTTLGASGSGVYLDSDDSANAKYVFITQVLNGTGLYRINAASPTAPPQTIYTAGEPHGMARAGNTLYFFSLGSNAVLSFDMYAATPAPKSVGTLPARPASIATDGVNVYAGCYDGNLYAISIATGNTTKAATAGPGSEAQVATDGAHVYVGGNNSLYRVPVANNGGTYASYSWVPSGSIPGGSATIVGIQLDANAVYFATYQDVFKTRK